MLKAKFEINFVNWYRMAMILVCVVLTGAANQTKLLGTSR